MAGFWVELRQTQESYALWIQQVSGVLSLSLSRERVSLSGRPLEANALWSRFWSIFWSKLFDSKLIESNRWPRLRTCYQIKTIAAIRYGRLHNLMFVISKRRFSAVVVAFASFVSTFETQISIAKFAARGAGSHGLCSRASGRANAGHVLLDSIIRTLNSPLFFASSEQHSGEYPIYLYQFTVLKMEKWK